MDNHTSDDDTSVNTSTSIYDGHISKQPSFQTLLPSSLALKWYAALYFGTKIFTLFERHLKLYMVYHV